MLLILPFSHVSFSLEWKALMLLSENSVCGSDDGTRTKLKSVVVVAQRNEKRNV